MAIPYKGTPDEGRYMTDAEFRIAELPEWSEEVAADLAAQDGLQLGAEHLEVLHLLRDHYRFHGNDLSGPRLLRALEEPFGRRGGKKHLFELFPGGPVTQGCRIAGLPAPPYSKDLSFGSVQ